MDEQGAHYKIMASSDLKTWTAIGDVVNTNGAAEFVDLDAPTFQQRFYRLEPASDEKRN
jgi:hypothetical protein